MEREDLNASKSLSYFLHNRIGPQDFTSQTLSVFARLDDYDIVSAMKEWQDHDDFVLSNLCKMIINRDLLKVKIKKKKPSLEKLEKRRQNFQEKAGVSAEEAAYFVFSGEVTNTAYKSENNNINILHKNGKISDVAKASDQLNLKALSKTVIKYYMCYPKAKH